MASVAIGASGSSSSSATTRSRASAGDLGLVALEVDDDPGLGEAGGDLGDAVGAARVVGAGHHGLAAERGRRRRRSAASSVATITRSSRDDRRAASTTWRIRGRPVSDRRGLPGRRVEANRAGITATTGPVRSSGRMGGSCGCPPGARTSSGRNRSPPVVHKPTAGQCQGRGDRVPAERRRGEVVEGMTEDLCNALYLLPSSRVRDVTSRDGSVRVAPVPTPRFTHLGRTGAGARPILVTPRDSPSASGREIDRGRANRGDLSRDGSPRRSPTGGAGGRLAGPIRPVGRKAEGAAQGRPGRRGPEGRDSS